jgi:GNAT superfamily N-acetyltransferase
LAKLSDRGFSQTGFHAVLYGVPELNRPEPVPGVGVRVLEESDFDLFGDLYVQSFGMPDWTKAGVAENNRLLSKRPGRTFYLATVDDAPAAVAGLFVADGIGNLAMAGTAPEHRGRGCQTALLHRRMYDAAQQGCELVVGQAAYLSPSMKNMQRAGLQLAYTKAFWTKRSYSHAKKDDE